MAVEVIMPQMGESIQEGTVVKWLKKTGEKVTRDEPLFEISTDKVDAEIPSPASGLLGEIKVKEGETVAIKTVVALIEAEGAGAAAGAAAAAQSAPQAATAAAASGGGPDRSASARPAAAVASPPGGAASRAAAPADAPAPSRGPSPARAAAASAAPPAHGRGEVVSLEERLRTRSSPVVRKLAEEHGIDISALEGTGISGRVTKKDILDLIERGGAAAAGRGAAAARALPGEAPAHAEPALRAVPAFAPGERIERVPMTPMRRKIAEHMILSRRTSAHVTTVFEIDMSRIAKIREAKKAAFAERHGANLTYLPFIMKAVTGALLAVPEVNASIDGTDIIYKKDVNLGLAVALDWGLIVPVVKNAQDLSLAGLAKAAVDLATRARNKQLKPEEVSGGTFTITNPGVFGSLFGTPIINQPQVAILGIGVIEKRPVVREDAIAIRTMAYFGISYDHRLVDGAVADEFMSHVKQTLQEFDDSLV